MASCYSANRQESAMEEGTQEIHEGYPKTVLIWYLTGDASCASRFITFCTCSVITWHCFELVIVARDEETI